MLNNFYQQQAAAKRKSQVDNLVNEGMLTDDQAASALGQQNPPPETPTASTNGTPVTPPTEQRLSDIQTEIEGMYRQTYGATRPTLSDLVAAASQDAEAYTLAQRNNFQKNIGKITAAHNAHADQLDTEAQLRVLQRIGKGNSVDNALGRRYIKTAVGLAQELADTGNRIDSWTKSGYGLPTVKKQWDQDVKDYSKYTMAGPVAATMGRIIKGTIVGFFEGIADIAKGDADLESFLHVGSMVAIPFTMGAAAAGAAANAAKAGMTMGNAARMGRVWVNMNKLHNRVKNITRDTTGTWGGLNFRKWGEMGPITKGSQVAEVLEYPTNPEELWYEIIGDVGIQGSIRAFQGSSEWVTEQLSSPEKQMHAQEQGIARRLKKVAKIDAGMAQAFQNIYESIGQKVGTDVSELRIGELDVLIERINTWEANTKFDWMTQTHTNDTEEELFVKQLIEAINARESEVNAQAEESARATTDSEEPVPTETPPEATGTEPAAQEAAQAPAQAAAQAPAQAPPEAPEEVETPPQTTTPEQQEVTRQAQNFSGLSLDDLDMGEMEGVNPGSITQGDENANRLVREEIESKAQQVYQQGEQYLNALADANEARAAADADPENQQLELVAGEKQNAAQDALENWLNVISPSIGQEPEGEETTNDKYIADEGARARRYQQLGEGFLSVAADPAVIARQQLRDGETVPPEVAEQEQMQREEMMAAANGVLAEHASAPADPQPAPTSADVPPTQTAAAPEAVASTPDEINDAARQVRAALEADGVQFPLDASGSQDYGVAMQKAADLGVDQVLGQAGDVQGVTEAVNAATEAPAAPAEQAAPVRSGTITQRVLDALDELPAASTAADIARIASTDAEPLSKKQVQRAIQALKKRGVVESTREGRSVRYSRAAQAAPEAEAEPAPPTEGEAYLDSLFDMDEEVDETDDESSVTLFSPTATARPNYTQSILEGLRTGATNPNAIATQIDRYRRRVTELSNKRVLSTQEARELRQARTRAAHLTDALSMWQSRQEESDIPDVIDGVLYFKMDTSSGPFKTLSNFFPAMQMIKGKAYPTVEHYFQAMKFAGTGLKMTRSTRDGGTQQVLVADAIRLSASPGDAWRIANEQYNRLTNEQRQKWIDKREQVMRDALFAKYQSPVAYGFEGSEEKTLAQWLLETGDLDLVHIEHVSTERQAIDDTPPYWGAHLTPRVGLVRTALVKCSWNYAQHCVKGQLNPRKL